jgi:flagellar protein FliO/FliZ
MLEALFGADMPLAVRFFLAFLIVLGLIGATAGAVRRFGSGRLGGAGARGRQPRLAVIDYASVDSRRRLILVRRDNIEHLVLIGGPTDVVVEANIVRAAPAATRETTVTRPPPAAETLPRAIPLPENGNGSWPLQPEPVGPQPRPAPRIEPDEQPGWPPPQHAEAPPARPARETLAAIADEIASRPIPPPRIRAGGAARPRPVEARTEQREPRPEPRSEPRLPQNPGGPDPQAVAAADQNLAEMAHRLEAALRKPKSAAEGRMPPPVIVPTPPAPEDAVDAAGAEAAPRPLRPARPIEEKPSPAQADGKPKEGKALYDSLEQEMASLLGRPAGKM